MEDKKRTFTLGNEKKYVIADLKIFKHGDLIHKIETLVGEVFQDMIKMNLSNEDIEEAKENNKENNAGEFDKVGALVTWFELNDMATVDYKKVISLLKKCLENGEIIREEENAVYINNQHKVFKYEDLTKEILKDFFIAFYSQSIKT